MRNILIMIFMMIASNIYAQKVLPFNEHLEDQLIEYLVDKNPRITREFMDTLKKISSEITDHANEYCEPIEIFDIQSEKFVDPKEMTSDFGVYTFDCPMIHGDWIFVLLKYHDSVIIIEDDLTPTDDFSLDWDYNTLMKHTEFLNSFFTDHPDIPKSYYPVFLQNLISVFELNHYE